jgi:type III restriction enzyme
MPTWFSKELLAPLDVQQPGYPSHEAFKDVREVIHSHVNLVVHDTMSWEQSVAYHLDKHPVIRAFVKNFGLNFTIPYLHNGEPHEYVPDFVARLELPGEEYLITELKGDDWGGLTEVKRQAAERWCAAINATGEFGRWRYFLAMKVGELVAELNAIGGGRAVRT